MPLAPTLTAGEREQGNAPAQKKHSGLLAKALVIVAIGAVAIQFVGRTEDTFMPNAYLENWKHFRNEVTDGSSMYWAYWNYGLFDGPVIVPPDPTSAQPERN